MWRIFLGIFFASLTAAQREDASKFYCRQPGPVKGPCNEKLDRWFHDFKSGNCIPFEYGGCNGNNNNFASQEDCQSLCKGTASAKFHSTKKGGTCVNFPNEPHWTPWGLCTHMCAQYDDASCPSDQKCCFNGCGFQCVHPDSASWGLKIGECPDPLVHPLESVVRAGGAAPPCMTDNSCRHREKCCVYPGVGSVCVPAVEDLEARAKPGTCRRKFEGEIDCGGEREECRRDEDCEGNEKCCDLGCGNECSLPQELMTTRSTTTMTTTMTTTTPTTTTTTTPTTTPTTEQEMTPDADACIDVNAACSDGQDPYLFCAQDSDCSVDQRCCYDGCGYVCGGRGIEVTNATTTRMTTTTETTTTPPPKPIVNLDSGLSPFKVFGWCPPPSTCNSSVFYLNCVTDKICPFDQKCCFNGCGYECAAPRLPEFLRRTLTTTPEPIVATTPSDEPTLDSMSSFIKKGFCRLEKKRCNGAGPASGETYFYQTCANDTVCEADAKCCFDGCGYDCQLPLLSDKQPLREKAGVCPPPGISNAEVALCGTDADCYGSYKCCDTLGGRECVPASFPVTDDPSNPPPEIPSSTPTPRVASVEAIDDVTDEGDVTSRHAYCRVTDDVPLPSGQASVVKGIVYLYETGFWGLGVRVSLKELPVPRGLPTSRRFPFRVEVLDSVDARFGCMMAPALVDGGLGTVEANAEGGVDATTATGRRKEFTIGEATKADSSSRKVDISTNILAISTAATNQRVACCRVQRCNHTCCQGPYTGHCMAFLRRYFYDWRSGECRRFVYGGCGAQRNNFATLEECERRCAGFQP